MRQQKRMLPTIIIAVITLISALSMTLALAGCSAGASGGTGGLGTVTVYSSGGNSGGNGSSSDGGGSPANDGGSESTNAAPESMDNGQAQNDPSAKPEPPIGGIDPKLIGTWTLGGSTLQVRKILTGKYDIKRIGLNSEYSVIGVSYTFYEDGTYMKIVLAYYNLIIVDGEYSVSNDIITFTNSTSKSTMKDDVPIIWEKTARQDDETHSYEINFSERLELNILYMDGDNSEPAAGYWFSDDEV